MGLSFLSLSHVAEVGIFSMAIQLIVCTTVVVPACVEHVITDVHVFFFFRSCKQVLGVNDDATEAEIKSSYRALAKVCHPDISGDDRGHNMCILLNEAYQILSDAERRREYNRALDEALSDEDDGYTGEIMSHWCANTSMGKNTDPNESRGVFVDELTCIGK